MNILIDFLEWIMNGCYMLCHNYGIAIILFTLISKIVMLPISIWVHKNSIKMVKMQPEINFLNVKYYGDADTIAEEQSKLFKREKYNPMATVIPLIIQIVLLMGVIEVIKAGMNNPAIDMEFFGVNLSLIPSENGVGLIFSPIIAGISAWLLCVAQNASNVLQAEQSNTNKYGTMIFSVGLSLYLGWFVSVGVAVYWVASNIMAIIQLYLLNWAINPKHYVDYEALEASKKALEEIDNLGSKKKRKFNDPEAKREKADYKRFFSVVNKHLVFYSESSGFYKYYRGIIEWLIENTNLTIHYITSDPNDAIFELSKTQTQIKPYFIAEKKLITLMMKMDADMVIMTMPDIENFHIKRSYVRKDIEYVYVQHCMDSVNMTQRKGCVDHYDTILCVGDYQKEEVLKTEAVYGLPAKNLIESGYTLLDEMRANYAALEKKEHEKKHILIAPSWQTDNIVDSCLEEILDRLDGKGYKVIVRPHPQHVRHRASQMDMLKNKYSANPDIEIQTDFSSDNTVFEADLVITDWSSISYEFAFTTLKPVLFINTPMKIMNPEYEKIDVTPINIWLREEIGASINLDQIDKVDQVVDELLGNSKEYHDKIDRVVNEHIYNLGTCAEVTGRYIVESLQKKVQERK